MKRAVAGLIGAALCLGLAGCGAVPPREAADGSAWDEEWVTVGGILGVDTPEGLTARENNDALAASGMYYASWSIGEAVPYVNADGEDAQLYDAHVYLLLSGHLSAEEAEQTAAEWIELAEDHYDIVTTDTQTFNGQEFSVYTYTFDSETNPYDRGASAFGVYKDYAVSVELSCQKDFDGDALEILSDFLEHCHYSA